MTGKSRGREPRRPAQAKEEATLAMGVRGERKHPKRCQRAMNLISDTRPSRTIELQRAV
jgi:hypothetical protein